MTLQFFDWVFKNTNELSLSYCLIHCSLDGRLDLVKYIYTKNRSSFNTKTQRESISDACMNGHLDVVKYLYEVQKCKLCEECFMAAEYNHLDTVIYLHQNKCPYNPNSLAQASCYGHYDMVKWLLSHGYEGIDYAVDHAAGRGDKRMIELLHLYGIYGLDPILSAKTRQQPREFIDWLRDLGYKVKRYRNAKGLHQIY